MGLTVLSPTDNELVVNIQSGQSEAESALYEKYSAKGYYLALRESKSSHDAEDVRAETFLRLIQAIRRNQIRSADRIGLLWFDYDGGQAVYDQARTYALVRKLQPQIIINNRLDLTTQENEAMLNSNADYYTPEQRIGAYHDQRPWETSMTLGTQWSWKPKDTIKSPVEVIGTLARFTGGDGNLLLDVGPMPDGRIEPRQVDVLEQVGVWMARNRESIYGTRGGPWKPTTNIASTRKGKTVYVHILKWPDTVLKLPDIPAKLVGAKLLNGGALQARQTQKGIEISVNPSQRDESDTVVVLTLDRDVMQISALPIPPTSLKTSATMNSHWPLGSPGPRP